MQRARSESSLIAKTPECQKLMGVILTEAERIDKHTMHTPAYTNEHYRVARDIYYWTCGQSNVLPREWQTLHTSLQATPSADLVLMQALAIQSGHEVPKPTHSYDAHRLSAMEVNARAFINRSTIAELRRNARTTRTASDTRTCATNIHGFDDDPLRDNGNLTVQRNLPARAASSSTPKSTPAPAPARAYTDMEAGTTITPDGSVVHAPPLTQFEPQDEMPKKMVDQFPWLKSINKIFSMRRKRKKHHRQTQVQNMLVPTGQTDGHGDMEVDTPQRKRIRK